MTERDDTYVVYRITEDGLESVGRGSRAEAERFCRSPKWPYKIADGDSFVAVDDWGYGTCVQATEAGHVGMSIRELRDL